MNQHDTAPNPISIRWDSVTIEAEARLLPDLMRDPYIWLKTYAREECNREIHLLVEAFREVEVFRDKTTWTRILRGQLTVDARGQERPTPLVKLESLEQDIKALRDNVSVASMRGRVPFVKTSTWETISNYIDVRRRPDRVNRFGVIIGHTGTQKTACFKQYVRLNNHGACVWMESPENGSIKEFMTMLAGCYGVGATSNHNHKRNKIFESVSKSKTIILDNTQDLYRDRYDTQQPAFGFLRRLQDETGCTVILSITPTFERKLVSGMMQGYFEQFEGRAGGRRNFLRLPEYSPDEDVLEIAKAMGLQHARQHLKELVRISHSPGRIRYFFEVLQDAKLTAEADGQKLTIDHVREVHGEE